MGKPSLLPLTLCFKEITAGNIRFLLPPTKKSKQSGSQHPCWRECGSGSVDQGHIYFNLFCVMPFWKWASHLFSEILDLKSDFSFTLEIFLKVSVKATHTFWRFSWSQAKTNKQKKTITKCWLQRSTSTIAQCRKWLFLFIFKRRRGINIVEMRLSSGKRNSVPFPVWNLLYASWAVPELFLLLSAIMSQTSSVLCSHKNRSIKKTSLT